MKYTNSFIIGKQIEVDIQDKLCVLLAEIPFLKDVHAIPITNDAGYDIEMIAIGNRKKLRFLCEVKSKGEPKYIRNAINQLLVVKEKLSGKEKEGALMMVAAPYISSTSAGICKEYNVSYIDLAGNCRIVHDGLFINIEGKPNPYTMYVGKNKSIFERRSVKSSIILRCLLSEPHKRWRVQELAQAADVSLGQIANVKKYLEEKEYLFTDNDGFYLKNSKALILEWAKQYNSKVNVTKECYSIDTPQQIEEKLIDMYRKLGVKYAVTAFSGAVRYAPTVRYNKIHVYIPVQHMAEVVDFFGCKEVTSGANISFISPYDECVMLDSREINQLQVAAPIQVCLDLLALQGRGEEAAVAVIAKEFQV